MVSFYYEFYRIFLKLEMNYFFRFVSSCLGDCLYVTLIMIGATFCVISLPLIVYFCFWAIFIPYGIFYIIFALIFYTFLARVVICGIKNVMCYKINGEVYNFESERVLNQNQNIAETQNQVQEIPTAPPRANFDFSDMDLPPSYTECVILYTPNKVEIPDSAPPPPYNV